MKTNRKKLKDSELVVKYIEYIQKNKPTWYDENAYYFGAYYQFDGLDVQNLKYPMVQVKK